MLSDSFGRVATDLRVSLTDRCNLRRCGSAWTRGTSCGLRAGAGDDQLADLWRQAVATKLPGHGINDPGFLQPTRPMSAIGG